MTLRMTLRLKLVNTLTSGAKYILLPDESVEGETKDVQKTGKTRVRLAQTTFHTSNQQRGCVCLK